MDREDNVRKPAPRYGCLITAGIAVALLYAASSTDPEPDSRPQLTAAERSACESTVKAVEKEGLVLGRPSPTRVNVDEVKWALLPADQKTALLYSVGCAALGKRPADYSFSDSPVVAYGYRSGKRLAMLTEAGMSFE